MILYYIILYYYYFWGITCTKEKRWIFKD